MTTGHQAQLLRKDAGYRPLLTYLADFKSVVVAASTTSYSDAALLRGTTVLGLYPSSLVTLWGQHWLKNNGVEAQVRYVSAADSVAQLILAGDASVLNCTTLFPEPLTVDGEPYFLSDHIGLTVQIGLSSGEPAGAHAASRSPKPR